MTGLIIEDDQSKADKILTAILKRYKKAKMIVRGSYQSGIKEVFDNSYEFILLDMSLPTYDLSKGNFGGKPRYFGGRDILKEMKRYKKESKVKVITQYNDFDGGSISMESLHAQLENKYKGLYLGYIFYDSQSNEWEKELMEFLSEINSK